MYKRVQEVHDKVFNDNNIHFGLHPSSGLDMDGLGDVGTRGGQGLRDPNIDDGSTNYNNNNPELQMPNVICLTQHFTSKFAPRQRGNMELSAFRREGSKRHIKGYERASK
ncbi:hypothetical protein R1flu_021332 [Riccia fluitans]|uniref:Uncharacterized protein n=1 Tax=Riccia fluitans TaxID=41844 RepID=A0ABD1ZP23_9MARC